MISLAIPPPTAVMNESTNTPVRLYPCEMAMSEPAILNETSPIESLRIKSDLFSMEGFL